MLSKSLIQFSVYGWGCVLSLLFDLRPNYGGGNEDDWVLLLKSCECTAVLRPCGRPPLTQASTRDLWTLTGKSRSVSCGVTAPFSWVLVHTRFYFCPSSFFCPSSVQVLAALWWDKWWPPPRGLMPQAVWDPGLLYRVPAPPVGHCWPVPPQEMFKHSKAGLAQSVWWVLMHTRFWALQASLEGTGFDSKCDFDPPTILMGLLLFPWRWGIFFWWDPAFSCQWLLLSYYL